MDTEQCSKCEADLDTTGYPKWCKSCRATYKREYNSLLKEMGETRGFAAGCTAMRQYLADNFERYGTTGMFSGIEIAALILQTPGPTTAAALGSGPRPA